MKVGKLMTESWHNYDEGDSGHPIDKKGKHLCFYKKGFWKRYDRKRAIRRAKKLMDQ